MTLVARSAPKIVAVAFGSLLAVTVLAVATTSTSLVLTPWMVQASGFVAAALAGLWWARRPRRRWLRRLTTSAATLALVVAATALAWAIATASGDRSPLTLDFGGGLTYERIALSEPHRQVFHVAVVDLDNPCVGLITTRPGDRGLVMAETGTAFLERTGVTLSVNAAFFYPFVEYPFWSATKAGDEMIAMGPVVIDGQWLGDVDRGGTQGLALTDGRLSASEIPADADVAVRGRAVLIADGQVVAPPSGTYARTVVGVDLDTNHLVMLVSDGKQPGYAEGSTYEQVAGFLQRMGVDEAVEFDGGGSSTMAAVVDGRVELLNRPIHQRIPNRQRPVASHLGITVDQGCLNRDG